MRSPKGFFRSLVPLGRQSGKAVWGREAGMLKGNGHALHLLPGWVCLRAPPFPVVERNKGQPREKKTEV